MEFFILDKTGKELGFLPDSAQIDMELGSDNGDMELTIQQGFIQPGYFVIAYGGEYGAVMEECTETTGSNFEVWRGNTFRKLLEQIVICPDEGQDYKVVMGDANRIISGLLKNQMGNFFKVESHLSGIYVKKWQFARYCTFLEGVDAMLSSVGARLEVKITDPFRVVVSAVPVVNYSDSVEFSEDWHAIVELTTSRRGINHLICLGKGELKDRTVLHLYAWPDGSVKKEPYFKGFLERSEVYDSSNADEAELVTNGTKRLKERMSTDTVSVSVSDVELSIGDIVSGRSYKTGRLIQAPVESKVVKLNDSGFSIEYKLGSGVIGKADDSAYYDNRKH